MMDSDVSLIQHQEILYLTDVEHFLILFESQTRNEIGIHEVMEIRSHKNQDVS